MLRLDLVYCICFSICHHARLRLIVWHFLIVKPLSTPTLAVFLHSVTGSVPNLRWEDFSASCCFMSALIRLSIAAAAAVPIRLKALNWPRDDISPAMSFDNYRSSHCGSLLRGSQWDCRRESQGSDFKGGLMLCKLEAGGNGCSAFHGLFPTSCGDRAHF